MSKYQVVNPATGEQGQTYPTATDDEVRAAIGRAHDAGRIWRDVPVEERRRLLHRVADLYRERATELARLMAIEMGKPIRSGRGEIGICDDIYRYYADNADDLLREESIPGVQEGTAVLRLAPLGVVLGIMPWNYPHYQVARFVAPNLLLGNTIILKHASQCPESALAIEQIVRDAGLPDGAYVNLFASNDQIASVIADNRVQGVSLTGSERAGAAIGELAGRYLKKVVLELGGSDPFIVLDTNDMDALVREAVVGRMGNCGQACNASKRFYILEDIYDDFLNRFTEAVRSIEPGDPLNEATTMGPMASASAAEQVDAQVSDAVAKGANVAVGGSRRGSGSAFFEPTVLTGVTPGMRAYDEEIFGPVAVVHKVPDIETALELANDSPYGLSASIHSRNPEEAFNLADRLDAGMVFVNEAPATSAELPFGGIKRSGFGRELGRLGLLEFANRKLVRARRVARPEH